VAAYATKNTRRSLEEQPSCRTLIPVSGWLHRQRTACSQPVQIQQGLKPSAWIAWNP